MTELDTVASRVEQATDYREVFGANLAAASGDQIKHVFRRLTRVLHPDKYTLLDEKVRAEKAFVRLTQLHNQAQKALTAGNYGRLSILATVRTRKCVHEILRPLGQGDLCATYVGQTKGAAEHDSFFKVARRPSDKDLLQTEAAALRRLHGKDADAKWEMFTPELIDSFVLAETGKPRRLTNAIVRLNGFYSLNQVRAAFPRGLSPLHAVWIWRRVLAALGYSHDKGVIHSAVLPRHIMILPEQHGVVLVDWCYASVAENDEFPAVKAIVGSHKAWYPEEILAKRPPSPATDIIMAARSLVELMGGDPLTGALPTSVPRPLRAFLKGCMPAKQTARPNDAWLLLKEFDELLERIGTPYYPRRFRPFTMPTGVV